MQSAMGRDYNFDVYSRTTGNGGFEGIHNKFVNTFPDVRVTERIVDDRGREVSIGADGMLVVNESPPSATYADPRFGYLLTSPFKVHRYTPGGTGRVDNFTRTAVMTDPTDPLSHTSLEIKKGKDISTYDAASRTWTHTNASNKGPATQTNFNYDTVGNLTSLTTPTSNSHSFSYDVIDQFINYSPPNVPGVASSQTSYSYNLDRDLTKVSRPDGNQLIYDIDPVTGKRNSLTIPRGTYSYSYDITKVCPKSSYSYKIPSDMKCQSGTPTGQLSAVAAPAGENLSFLYDGALLTETTWSGTINGSVRSRYNDDFNIYRHDINGTSNFITYTFDSTDRLLIEIGGDGNYTIKRDETNRYPTRTAVGFVRTDLTYNGFGEVIKAESKYKSSKIYHIVDYMYDNAGRIIERIETVESDPDLAIDYIYDADGRLSKVIENGSTVESYLYDSNGNRLSATVNGLTSIATYDAQDRLISYGDNTYTYNNNGDLESKTNSSTSETTNYVYDALGSLISVDLPDGRSIEYVVDGLNRRIGKKIDGVLQNGLLYKDQLNPIAELDQLGDVVSIFGYGEKAHVPVYMKKYGVEYKIVTDQVGSVILVIDRKSTQVVQRMDYDSFGNVILDTNPGFQPFGFAGGLYDPDTKLTRFGARDYDAEVGRWTVKDPIGFDGDGPNLYEYVVNDPVNLTDSTGLRAGAAKKVFEYCRKIRCKGPSFDGPHHRFRWLGGKKYCHVQLNCYLKGVKGSGASIRIPIPCRFVKNKGR